MSNAETLARVVLEIEMILAEYTEAKTVQDPKLVVEQIILQMDTNDAAGVAERLLAGYTGPTLVK